MKALEQVLLVVRVCAPAASAGLDPGQPVRPWITKTRWWSTTTYNTRRIQITASVWGERLGRTTASLSPPAVRERGWRLMETNVSRLRISKGDQGRVLSLSPQGISHFGGKMVWIYSEDLVDWWTFLGSSHTACQVFYRWQKRFGQSAFDFLFFSEKNSRKEKSENRRSISAILNLLLSYKIGIMMLMSIISGNGCAGAQ